MSQVRAFLAIDLDEVLKPKISDLIDQFKPIDTKIKFVELENLHFTLKFFGNVDSECIDSIQNVVGTVISDFKPFKIHIKKCGSFPNKNRINVIWVGIDEDTVLKELHDRLDKEFTKLGFKKDKKFSSHLTIGRMKSKKNKQLVRECIEENEEIEIGEMQVNKISLKKSTLTPSGPIYENLKVFEL